MSTSPCASRIVGLPFALSIHPVSALPLPQVRFIEMLVDDIALLIVQILRVHPWQTIQNLLNRHQDHGSSGLLLPPVQYQLFLLELFQERFRHLLDFRPDFVTVGSSGAGAPAAPAGSAVTLGYRGAGRRPGGWLRGRRRAVLRGAAWLRPEGRWPPARSRRDDVVAGQPGRGGACAVARAVGGQGWPGCSPVSSAGAPAAGVQVSMWVLVVPTTMSPRLRDLTFLIDGVAGGAPRGAV